MHQDLMCRFRWPAIALAVALMAPGVLISPLYAMQQAPPQYTGQPGEDPHAADEQAAERQALGFLSYLDNGRFADSYAYTGMLIRTQLDRESFAAKVEKTRAGFGALQGREMIDASYTNSVPGAPEGQYVILHYHANFTNRPDEVETVTLAFAKGYWRIVGYYIK
jgi:hypothetical protein